jgi:hypothetical protein
MVAAKSTKARTCGEGDGVGGAAARVAEAVTVADGDCEVVASAEGLGGMLLLGV